MVGASCQTAPLWWGAGLRRWPSGDPADSSVMRSSLVACLVALTLGPVALAQVPSQPRAPIGVLVGVHRSPDSASDESPPVPATLRTLWFETSRETVANTRHLLVPRSSGFWRIQLVHFCGEEPAVDFESRPRGDALTVSEQLWAYPVEAPPNVPNGAVCRSRNVHCVSDHRKLLFWVWPDFISMQNYFESPGCGASMWSSLDFAMRRIENMDRAATVSEAIGPGAEERLRSAFDEAKLEDAQSHGPECVKETTFDPASWRIVRAGGGWHVEGWANTHRLCGVGFEYTANLDLSRVTGRTTLPQASWKDVAGATDALASPDGQWVLIVKKGQVVLAPRDAPRRPIASATLSEDENVVMAEWATGANVARWRRQVRAGAR